MDGGDMVGLMFLGFCIVFAAVNRLREMAAGA